jgi:hypothetical protein
MSCVYSILGCVVLCVVLTICGRIRLKRIAASRAGETFETFRSSFEADEAKPEILRVVHGKFQAWVSGEVSGFPVRADDNIADIYGMVDEDLDDTILEILAECGRQSPPDEELRRMTPLVTVRDLVLFVASSPSRKRARGRECD